MAKVPLRDPRKNTSSSSAHGEEAKGTKQAKKQAPAEKSAASAKQKQERAAVRTQESGRRQVRSEEKAPKGTSAAKESTASKKKTRTTKELRAEEKRLDRRARSDERELRAEEKRLDRTRRVEEKQAEEKRRSEARILREEERNLDARRRVEEKRAAEERRAEEKRISDEKREEERRRREWEARENEKDRRRRSKLAKADARVQEKEHRLEAQTRKRRLKEAKRREREERRRTRADRIAFCNPAWRGHTVIAVLVALVAVYIAVSMLLREHAGGFGYAIAGALLGCFSYTAFLIPTFMLIHAALWQRDIRDGALAAKLVSFLPLLLMADVLAALPTAETVTDPSAAYAAGQTYVGGGAVGATVARVLLESVGIVGILLIALIAFVPCAILYFRTPIRMAMTAARTRAREKQITRVRRREAAKDSVKEKPASEGEREKEKRRLPNESGARRRLRVPAEPREEKPSEPTVTEPPAVSQESKEAPTHPDSEKRKELFQALEEDVLTVERQQMDSGNRGRRVFDFESIVNEAASEEDELFAPPAPVSEPTVSPLPDLMGWDDGDDFSEDTLAVTTERLRPVKTEKPNVPRTEPSTHMGAAPQATAAQAAPVRPATAEAAQAHSPEKKEDGAGLDYFRSITVNAAVPPEQTASPIQKAPSAAQAAPAAEAVWEAPSATEQAVHTADEPMTAPHTAASFSFDVEDMADEEEFAPWEEDEADEDETFTEETPFTATSSLRTDLAAMQAATAPVQPRERTDGAFRPLTVPDEWQESAPVRKEPPKPKRPYSYPPISLLALPEIPDEEGISAEIQSNAQKLVQTLENFRVHTHVSGYSRGPRITRYEVVPEAGVRVRSISNLVEDISMSLATSGIRIEAPIPGKSAVGVEVPNSTPTTVRLRHLLDTEKFRSFPEKTVVCLGEEVTGQPVYCDLAKTPHMLIAGATGMGKSVCINSIITSILYKASPDEVKLIMIDPKKVEFSLYAGIPHLLVPVVTDPKKAAGALSWAVSEMERRFSLFENVGVRDAKGYNRYLSEGGEGEPLARIIIIIDELHDLMMSAKDAVETSIARITAKARAAGIHLLIGTQRPSVDVITGTIKNNIPTRIAFRVSSQVDSRTILDFIGAEKLLPHGDMLYAAVGAPKPLRVQGAFVDEKEIERIVDYIKTNNDSMSDEEGDRIMADIEREAEKCTPQKKGDEDDVPAGGGMNIPTDDDDHHLQWAALEVGFEFNRLSTSLLQRKLKIGYGKAAKILDTLCEEGYISEPDGAKPREILISREDFKEMMARTVHEQTGGNF